MFESGLSDGLARIDWGWAGRQESVSGTDAPGASLAYAMSRDGISSGKKIVLLEAKDVASGACKWLRANLSCAAPAPSPLCLSSVPPSDLSKALNRWQTRSCRSLLSGADHSNADSSRPERGTRRAVVFRQLLAGDTPAQRRRSRDFQRRRP